MAGLVDLHSHILPGLDDGPANLEGALELARATVADGVRRIAATPHIHPQYVRDAAERDAPLTALVAALDEAGVALEVLAGGEIDLGYAATWDDDQLAPLGIGGGPALLIEFPWETAWPVRLTTTCRDLRRRGFLPIVAHPERIAACQREPDRLWDVIAAGAVCQVTAGSLAGSFGDRAEELAFELLARGEAHLVASDAHAALRRGPSLKVARAAVARRLGDEYADALFEDAPDEILAGRVPELPAPREQKRRALRWR